MLHNGAIASGKKVLSAARHDDHKSAGITLIVKAATEAFGWDRRLVMRTIAAMIESPSDSQPETPTRRFAPTSPFQGEVEQAARSCHEAQAPEARLALPSP
jgi:hypothetical protein